MGRTVFFVGGVQSVGVWARGGMRCVGVEGCGILFIHKICINICK